METTPKHRERERYAVNVRIPSNLNTEVIWPDEHSQEIQDKLCIYFQSKKGGNCDVENIRLIGGDVNGMWYKVAFDEQSGVSHVLAKSDHAMDFDGVKIPLEVQGCPASPCTSESSSAETSPTLPVPPGAVTDIPDQTATEDMYGVEVSTKVSCHVPTCRAPHGLGNQSLTNSSYRRGSDDMYGKDEHHRPQGPRLLGHIVSPPCHQAQGNMSGIWAPQGGTMETNLALGFQGLQWPLRSMPNEHDFLNFHYRGNQGNQFAGNYPSGIFSPDQLPLPDRKLPLIQASSPHGESFSPNAADKSPVGEQKQFTAQTGIPPFGMLEKYTHHNVSGIINKQACRAEANIQDLSNCRAAMNKQDQLLKGPPGAAVRTSLGKNSSVKADSGIKKETLLDDTEEDEQQIEVTGLKQSTCNEVLKLYFENQRKSGGGEIEMLERDSKTGAVKIIFKNPSVAAAVEARKHKLSGNTLNVKLITKKKRRPLPIKAQCLFLKGIPDGCSSEHVKFFIENRAAMDEKPTIQYGEKPGTALCTFSRDIPGVSHVLAKSDHATDIDGVEIPLEVQGCQAPPGTSESSSAETSPTLPVPPGAVTDIPDQTATEDMYGVEGSTKVSCHVPTCRAPHGLGNQSLTNSSYRRGSDDMYGKDEHHRPQGPRLLGHIVSPPCHQAQGNMSGIWAPQGGTMETNLALGFQGLQWPLRSMPNEHDFLNFHYRGNQGNQFAGNYPSGIFSPDQLPLPDRKLPLIQASSPHGESFSPNAADKSPVGEQKQFTAQTGIPPFGMLEKYTHHNVSGIINKQACRAEANIQDLSNCRAAMNKHDQLLKGPPGAAVRTSLGKNSSVKADSGIKKETLLDDTEEDQQQIEVTGLKQSTGNEVLKLYFENQRKSGGGEIEMLERDSKTGAVKIIFKNPSVAAAVEARKHKLSGNTLNVKLITKKKYCPLPIKAQCLFLKGIPDGWSSEHVKFFIENRVSMDEEPTIQYGEKPGTALCTFSRDIPDLDAVVTNISKKKLQGIEIIADKVHEADAVLVTGFPQDINVDMIELYFDNKKKSGGSGVTDVKQGPMDGQAIVYFEDWKVVNEVLRRDTHSIGRTAVRVQMYHECLGKLSHGEHVFISNIPDKPSPEQLKRGKEAVSIKGAEAQETVQKVGMKIPQVDRRVQVPLQAQQEVKNVDTWGMFQGNLEEDYEQLIEVTGFKQTTDDEVMRLYFENPRKSGGGEIETMERDPKTGAVRFTFKNPSVTSIVAGKKHKLSGSQLKVKLITKRKRCPLPIKAQCLFLRGIPDGCSSEHVKVFIENRAAMDEEPMIQYGEKPGTALCTFSRDIPDLEAVIRKICERKLRNASIKAEKIQHSDAILVQGVSQDLEMIELYFDNKKKSGGTGVREVQPGPMDGQAIVYFENWRVIQDVLAKGPHKLGGTELLIESYHEFLGRLSQFDAPTPHIPKPVLVEVQEPIMEFLYGKGKNSKKKLLKELTKVKANLQWPDGSQKSQAKLEPVTDDSQHQSSWLNWNKEVADVLTDFMKGYKTARIQVPQSLWKDAADTLQKATSSCSMFINAQLHEVILVGEQKDVDVTEANISDVIKKLQKQAEYDAEQAKEDISWDAEKLQLFTLCGIKQEIEKSFPALKITVFSLYGKTGITLDGIRKTIKEVELQIRRMMDSLEKTEFKAGSIKVRFVQHVPDKIHEVLGSQNIHAACRGCDDGKITIYGATSRDVMKAKAYIDDEIDEDVITIKGQNVLAVIQGHDGKRLLDGVNNQKFVMVRISHETGPRCIKLAGFKRNLNETKKQIMDFLKKNVIIKSIIPSNKSKLRLITTYHGQELEKVRQQHQTNLVAIQPQMSGRNRGFIIQGNEEGLEAVRKLVTPLVEAVKEKQYPVSKTGMARLFREEKGKTFLESVEKEFHCVINTDWQEDSDDDDEEEEGAGLASTATQILYSVTLPDSTCRLRVCKGDLTRQRVDCIVNAANIELKHIGGLAAAVLEAGGTVIQSESNQILKQKKRTLYLGEAVSTSSGNLPCKKVIHVAGPRWPHWVKINRGGITSEEHQLFSAISNCLQLASELKFQSIAIPAISTGVYGFPVKLAAQQILNAVAQFVWTVPNSSVTDISLTNNDQPTCAVFMQAVAERFDSSLDDQAAGTDVDMTVAVPFGGRDQNRPQNRPNPVELPNPATETPRFTVSGLNVITQDGMTIKMTKGSIAVEAVDVIVNTAGSDMNLTSGKVSQAISQAAGPTLQQECNTLIATRGNVASWLFVETGPGGLTCKKIYHCVCEGYKQFHSEQLLKKLVVKLMVHACSKGMTSMAIPALGTGNLSYPPAVTARCMYEAAFEFSRQQPNGSLKDVRFVVYDKDMNTIKGFEDEIQRLYTSSPGATGGTTGNTNKKMLKKTNTSTADFFKKVSHGTDRVPWYYEKEEELQETIILQLCAMDMNSLIKVSDKLDKFQEEEFLSEDFPDVIGLIDKMTKKHFAELKRIGRKHNVTAKPSKGRAKFIRVEGCQFNVKDALLEILHLFLRIQKEETEKQMIGHLTKEVTGNYSINPLAARFETASQWGEMNEGELFKMVTLTAGTNEYKAVETKFRTSPMSAFNRIVEIQRVQNQALLMQYQARKAALEIRLKRSNIEKVLYHGADEQTCNTITKHGFNRSFCGKNATTYGNGSYFAVQAAYSAKSQYAKPNANGIMHILMSKVLVGDYIRGCQELVAPPKKPQSKGEMYDSVVDNMNAPGIFVIFHDAQAYPEYLIKFQ